MYLLFGAKQASTGKLLLFFLIFEIKVLGLRFNGNKPDTENASNCDGFDLGVGKELHMMKDPC